MGFSHVIDLAVALLAGLLTWKLPAMGIPIDEKTAHELAAAVFYAIGKLQKSPVPSLAPPEPPKPPVS